MFSSGVFLIGSLACGLAQSYPQLLAARAFAGVGGAGLTVMVQYSTLIEIYSLLLACVHRWRERLNFL